MIMDPKFKVLDLHDQPLYKDYVRTITEVGTSTSLLGIGLGDDVTIRTSENALHLYLLGYLMDRFRDIKNDRGELIWM